MTQPKKSRATASGLMSLEPDVALPEVKDDDALLAGITPVLDPLHRYFARQGQ